MLTAPCDIEPGHNGYPLRYFVAGDRPTETEEKLRALHMSDVEQNLRDLGGSISRAEFTQIKVTKAGRFEFPVT